MSGAQYIPLNPPLLRGTCRYWSASQIREFHSILGGDQARGIELDSRFRGNDNSRGADHKSQVKFPSVRSRSADATVRPDATVLLDSRFRGNDIEKEAQARR